MSKKHNTEERSLISSAHAEEYKIITHDMIKVVLLNVLYLAAVLALYYSNKSSHFLEKFTERLF